MNNTKKNTQIGNLAYGNIKVVFIFVIALLVQGCFEDKPSSVNYKQKLQENLPKHFTIKDIDIEAQENTGDSVDPNWKSRITVTFKLNEPLYSQTDRN